MKYLVTGGTHLGIVSCYGEKEFEAKNEKELFELIDKNLVKNKILDSEKGINNLDYYFDGSGKIIWVFTSENHYTLFEFYYKEVKGNVRS